MNLDACFSPALRFEAEFSVVERFGKGLLLEALGVGVHRDEHGVGEVALPEGRHNGNAELSRHLGSGHDLRWAKLGFRSPQRAVFDHPRKKKGM